MTGAGVCVLVTTSFPIAGDGSEAAGSFVSDLVDELAQHLCVRVIAPGPVSRRERRGTRVEVFRYAAPEQPLSTLKPWRIRDAGQILRVLKSGKTALNEAMELGGVGHVLALWAFPSGYWARKASRRFVVPYSAWALGSDIWGLARIPLLRALISRILRDARFCFADGVALAAQAQRLAQREVEFLASARSLAPVRDKQLADGPPYKLLFLGRWHRNKGVDLLLDSLNLLREEVWNKISRIEIFGGGPLEESVKAQVSTLQRAGRPVLLGGFLAKDAAGAALRASDFVLLPSRIESIPLIYSDAIKMGCPVVAMPVGDLPALIASGGTGVCASAISAAAFAGSLEILLHRPPASYAEHLERAAQPFDLACHVVPRLLQAMGLPTAMAARAKRNQPREVRPP
ncbi:MAG: glycosyltransferase [Lysobacterales bacterium]